MTDATDIRRIAKDIAEAMGLPPDKRPPEGLLMGVELDSQQGFTVLTITMIVTDADVKLTGELAKALRKTNNPT